MSPSNKGFVGFKGLVLGAENVNICETGVIISKGDVVSSTSKAGDWRWPPEVGMNFRTKIFGWWCDAFGFDIFASQLGIFA